ncbi:MAG TPA: hypothetical protein VFV38_06870 [Ktedonobacteraceae bacterium]|nr:hypothetical protein [Ktedonobacteraceae bacterium]
MTNTSSIGAIALTRFQVMRQQHNQEQKQSEANSNNSIELPAAIKNLITGSDFWVTAKTNRYKKLIREGHLRDLLELANIALTKNNPANWFAKVCSVKAWERTLDFLEKLYRVRKKTEAVLSRIGKGVEKLVYKHAWAGKSVERYAVAAQEIGKDRHKLFAWLCQREANARA